MSHGPVPKPVQEYLSQARGPVASTPRAPARVPVNVEPEAQPGLRELFEDQMGNPIEGMKNIGQSIGERGLLETLIEGLRIGTIGHTSKELMSGAAGRNADFDAVQGVPDGDKGVHALASKLLAMNQGPSVSKGLGLLQEIPSLMGASGSELMNDGNLIRTLAGRGFNEEAGVDDAEKREKFGEGFSQEDLVANNMGINEAATSGAASNTLDSLAGRILSLLGL